MYFLVRFLPDCIHQTDIGASTQSEPINPRRFIKCEIFVTDTLVHKNKHNSSRLRDRPTLLTPRYRSIVGTYVYSRINDVPTER